MAARYRRLWLVFALAPLIVMLPLSVHAGLAYAAGSNAWPVLLLLASPVALVYLLVVGATKASVAGR